MQNVKKSTTGFHSEILFSPNSVFLDGNQQILFNI